MITGTLQWASAAEKVGGAATTAAANPMGSAYKMGEPSNLTQGGSTPPVPSYSVPQKGVDYE